jgi:hypothetical protein
VWAGVLPLPVVPGAPLRDPRLPRSVELPDHVRGWGSGAVSRGRGVCE